ncbi:MAG: RAD55 family ATPase [Promethearchaeota archaeon]
METIPKIKTGILSFDEFSGGGLPKNAIYLVTGGPGSGKSIFTYMFVYFGALNFNEKSMLITTLDSREHIIRYTKTFGWDLGKLEQKGILILKDLSKIPAAEDFGSSILFNRLMEAVVEAEDEAEKVERIVLDSATSVISLYTDPIRARRDMIQLTNLLRRTNATTLITNEVISTVHQIEEYLVDGVIKLSIIPKSDEFIRVLQISKLRGSAHPMRQIPYKITEHGIELSRKTL